jgi:hypothetical protein
MSSTRRPAARAGASCTARPPARCYYISDTTLDYVLDAVHLVADHGHKLLALYRFDPATGHWEHRDAAPVRLNGTAPETVLADQLEIARRILAHPPSAPAEGSALSHDFERIRWFTLPSEARPRSHPAGRGVGTPAVSGRP